MLRRQFLGFIGGAASWPMTGAYAQKSPVRLGVLGSGTAGSIFSRHQIDAINQGLRNVGLIEGRDYLIEARFAAGNYGRFPALARELAETGVSVILASTIASVRAAQTLNPPIPIVMISTNDPVGAKLVASLSQPGGYTTGLANLTEDLTPKLLEFQHAIHPNAKTIAVLYNPANPTNPIFVERIRSLADGFTMRVLAAEFNPGAIDATIARLTEQGSDTLHLLSDAAMFDASELIAASCLRHRLPSFSTYPDFASSGGLLAYGTSRRQLYMRSGYFVKRILEGARPADLPIEQPTRIELAINLKTARALGIDISASLLGTADEVIE
jgi:putative tryptophan/tyrosine transport system substrate-binding protein